LASISAKMMTLLASPILLAFIFLPGLVLTIFGSEFRDGSSALTILALGQFVNVATGSVGYILIMTGHERTERNIAASFVLINAILNFILIPRLGIEGAALATATSLALRNLTAYFVLRYKRLIGPAR
jgi:O-antigen/teichoic acid export membrane protein